MTIVDISRQEKHGFELVIDNCGLTAHRFTAFKFSALYRNTHCHVNAKCHMSLV